MKYLIGLIVWCLFFLICIPLNYILFDNTDATQSMIIFFIGTFVIIFFGFIEAYKKDKKRKI